MEEDEDERVGALFQEPGVACSASSNFIAYVGQSVALQMETNRFPAIVIGFKGVRKRSERTMRWKNNAGVAYRSQPL